MATSVWRPFTLSQLSVVRDHGDITNPWPDGRANHPSCYREAVFRRGPEGGGRRVLVRLPRNGENWAALMRRARRFPLRHAWWYDIPVVGGMNCSSENGQVYFVWKYALIQVQCERKRSNRKCFGWGDLLLGFSHPSAKSLLLILYRVTCDGHVDCQRA